MLVPINKDGTKKAKKDYSDDEKDYMSRWEAHDKKLRVNRAIRQRQEDEVAKSLGVS